MAKDVYSLRIFAHASLEPSGGVNGPVVPDGLVYVLRDIDVWEGSDAGGTLLFVYNPVGGPMWAAAAGTTVQTRNFQWRGRQVYAPGEQVGFQSLAGSWAIMASGYQLTLP